MFFRRRTGNEQVIDVGITEGKPTKDLVNEPLGGLCCVEQAKRHSSEFEQPKGRSDSCFVDVGGLHWDLVVCPNQIDLGEDGRAVPWSEMEKSWMCGIG